MKTLVLAPLVIAVVCHTAAAQVDPLSVPHITVNGTAITEVVPDRLHWALEVKNTGLELPKVAESHSKKVAAALETLKANGVADKDVQTAQMEFSENRVYRRNEWVKEGYQATTNISFKLNDLTKYKAVWQSLAGLTGVSVTGVSFDHTNRINLNKEARVKALKAAREKAEAMAGVLGSKVGEPLNVEEDLSVTEGWRSPSLVNGSNLLSNVTQSQALGVAPAEAESSGPLAPGAIPITIRVRVTFRLLNPGI
jgi:uncharacterized protein YggE